MIHSICFFVHSLVNYWQFYHFPVHSALIECSEYPFADPRALLRVTPPYDQNSQSVIVSYVNHFYFADICYVTIVLDWPWGDRLCNKITSPPPILEENCFYYSACELIHELHYNITQTYISFWSGDGPSTYVCVWLGDNSPCVRSIGCAFTFLYDLVDNSDSLEYKLVLLFKVFLFFKLIKSNQESSHPLFIPYPTTCTTFHINTNVFIYKSSHTLLASSLQHKKS